MGRSCGCVNETKIVWTGPDWRIVEGMSCQCGGKEGRGGSVRDAGFMGEEGARGGCARRWAEVGLGVCQTGGHHPTAPAPISILASFRRGGGRNQTRELNPHFIPPSLFCSTNNTHHAWSHPRLGQLRFFHLHFTTCTRLTFASVSFFSSVFTSSINTALSSDGLIPFSRPAIPLGQQPFVDLYLLNQHCPVFGPGNPISSHKPDQVSQYQANNGESQQTARPGAHASKPPSGQADDVCLCSKSGLCSLHESLYKISC